MNCKKCNNEVSSPYCPHCGYPSKLKRIDAKHIIHELGHVFHFERGIFYTIKALFTKPGESIKNYLLYDRSKLIKPVTFIMIVSVIHALCQYFFHIDSDLHHTHDLGDGGRVGVNSVEPQLGPLFTRVLSILHWMRSHYGYASMIIGIFIALWMRLFFKKYKYGLFETLALLCYVLGTGMLIYSALRVTSQLAHWHIDGLIILVCYIYIVWALGQFYDKTKISSYLKSLSAYLLGVLTFYCVAILVAELMNIFSRFFSL